jgi:hypothetical protein
MKATTTTTTTKTTNKGNAIFEVILNTIYVGGFVSMFIFTILQVINQY